MGDSVELPYFFRRNKYMINDKKERATELPSQKRRKAKTSQNKIYKSKEVEVKKEATKVEPTSKKIENKIRYTTVPLNGRKKPSFSGEIIKIYQPNTKLTIVEEIGDWSKNSEGIYVKTEFLK